MAQTQTGTLEASGIPGFPSHARLAFLSETVPGGLLVYFRRLLAYHLWLQALRLRGNFLLPEELSRDFLPSALLAVALLLASWNAGARRGFLPGLLVLLAVKLGQVFVYFPWTPNHYYLEACLLIWLVLCPAPEPLGVGPGEPVDGAARNLILTAWLSVWIYSACQKLGHGYWLSGEYVARLLSSSALLGPLFQEIPEPTGYTVQAFQLPSWKLALVLGMSWGALLGELCLPLLVLARYTYRGGRILLLLLAILVAALSGEGDFFFTNAACALLLFEPVWLRRAYLPLLSLNAVFAAVTGWMIWAHR